MFLWDIVSTPFVLLAFSSQTLSFGQSSPWNANLQRRGLVKVKGTEICFVDGTSKWLHSAQEELQTYFLIWSSLFFFKSGKPWTVGYSFFEEVDPGVEGEIGGEETSRSLLPVLWRAENWGQGVHYWKKYSVLTGALSSCSNVSQQSNWRAEKAAGPWNCQGALLLRGHVRYQHLQSWTLKHLWRLVFRF